MIRIAWSALLVLVVATGARAGGVDGQPGDGTGGGGQQAPSGRVGTGARELSGFRYGVGVGFALPSAGLSLHARFDERHSGSLVLGELRDGVDGFSFQAQVNRGRDSSRGGYLLLGVGNDDPIPLVRPGIGYRIAVLRRLHIDLEVAVNIPAAHGR